jgi:hypothetical protein
VPEEPSPIGEDIDAATLRLLDPAVLERYEQMKAEYRAIVKGHRERFRDDERWAKRRPEKVQAIREALEALLRYEAEVFR